jgi:hypothetical protein
MAEVKRAMGTGAPWNVSPTGLNFPAPVLDTIPMAPRAYMKITIPALV